MNRIIDFSINEEEIDSSRIKEIEELCKNNMPISESDVNALLKNLSYLVRKKIANHENVDMQDYSYSYKCDLAQSMIYYYLNQLNINANPVNTNEVIKDVCGHSIITTKINTTEGEKIYLKIKHNEEVIKPLLEDGYIEFSEDVAKAYGDSFFQTKTGVTLKQMQNDVATGSSYIRWFQKFKARLSKTEEELSNMNLLITSDNKKNTKHK